jgi:hypothetical protein
MATTYRGRWKIKNSYKIIVGKPKGYSPSGRNRHLWEDNIRMNLGEKSENV